MKSLSRLRILVIKRKIRRLRQQLKHNPDWETEAEIEYWKNLLVNSASGSLRLRGS